MTTAIDTNVLVALWDADPNVHRGARSALDAALDRGALVISACVYSELVACPGRTEFFLDTFLKETGIVVEWKLEESVWRAAGRAFQAHAVRRKSRREAGPRRIMADFLIGAHALENKYRLLTFDDQLYRSAFPSLNLVTF